MTILDHQHLVLGCPERQLAHDARLAQLVCRQLAESRHDTPSSGDSDQLQEHHIKNVISENSSAQTRTNLYSVARKPVSCYLDFRTADPTHGRKLLVQEQVIRLVIKAPLTDDEICTGFLHLR